MKQKYKVSGMTCAACSRRVETAVESIPGVTQASVNLLTGELTVLGDVKSRDVMLSVRRAGYGISEDIGKAVGGDKGEKAKRMLAGLALSILISLILMYFSMGHMINAPIPSPFDTPLNNGILQLMLAAIVMAINYRFFKKGISGAYHLAPNMDTLVSLGSFVSFAYSVFVLFGLDNLSVGHPEGLYFESAAMILTLISVGKLLEEKAKGRTTDAIESLIALAPKTCTVIVDGVEHVIPLEELKVGDVFAVRPGEQIATDAVVISGGASIDESMLTGESVPVYRKEGDRVFGSTVNKSGYMTCRAASVGEDTALSQIIAMVRDATAGKAPIARIADRVAGIFVPFVLLISLLTFTLHMTFTGIVESSVSHAIAVLVISCPCALGLATPVAIMVGAGLGAKKGILYKNAEAEEACASVRIVVLDKTGTVTKGEMSLTDVYPINTDEEHLISLASGLEHMSEHPIARAIVKYADEGGIAYSSPASFESLEGRGVKGIYDGKETLAVSFGYAESLGMCTDRVRELCSKASSLGRAVTVIIEDGELIGVLALSDTPKDDARIAVSTLHKMGYRTVMLTGDNRVTAEAVAKSVGIDEVIAEVLPSGKEEVIRSLKKEGSVCMVGDGINDAPALALADVGMAIGCGTDIAIDTADVVIMTGGLMAVPHALSIGRMTLKNIKENLFFAFCYNVIGIPLAAGLFGVNLPPMFGALAMSLSSSSVVLNALRLGRKRLPAGESDAVCECENNEAFDKIGDKEMKEVFNVVGMMCPHCERRVKEAVESLESVVEAIPSHKDGTLTVTFVGECDSQAVIEKIVLAGYEVK